MIFFCLLSDYWWDQYQKILSIKLRMFISHMFWKLKVMIWVGIRCRSSANVNNIFIAFRLFLNSSYLAKSGRQKIINFKIKNYFWTDFECRRHSNMQIYNMPHLELTSTSLSADVSWFNPILFLMISVNFLVPAFVRLLYTKKWLDLPELFIQQIQSLI